MQQGTFAEAMQLCTEATGTHVRVLRVFQASKGVFSAFGSRHSERFWGHDVPWRDAELAANRECGWGAIPDRDLSWLGQQLHQRRLGSHDFHCACLPHQFWSWWGDESEWDSENALAVVSLDVNDLIVLNQQVLVLHGPRQHVVRVFD